MASNPPEALVLPEEFASHKEEIYRQLDTIVQSSAMVEAINSIIRPYLNNSKNIVSQAQLNLIMFYHNNRIYRSGKRGILHKYSKLLYSLVAARTP